MQIKGSQETIHACLLGTAVGDAIGLSCEGMPPWMIKRLARASELKHRFLFGRGMWSDDTEHALMIAQALSTAESPDDFAKRFARLLKGWFLRLPAGIGFATLRSAAKLLVGFPHTRSGVFSAGNGPAMRAALIGACFPHDQALSRELCRTHTQTTHTDPKALAASLAITELAALFSRDAHSPCAEQVETLRAIPDAPEWQACVSAIEKALAGQFSLSRLIDELGGQSAKGVSGYALHSVPVAIYAGMRADWNFEATIHSLVEAGGDTDTTAAMAGALSGIRNGCEQIPSEWIEELAEWPVRRERLAKIAERLAANEPVGGELTGRPWELCLRNVVFTIVVLGHVLVRPMLFAGACLRRS